MGGGSLLQGMVWFSAGYILICGVYWLWGLFLAEEDRSRGNLVQKTIGRGVGFSPGKIGHGVISYRKQSVVGWAFNRARSVAGQPRTENNRSWCGF